MGENTVPRVLAWVEKMAWAVMLAGKLARAEKLAEKVAWAEKLAWAVMLAGKVAWAVTQNQRVLNLDVLVPCKTWFMVYFQASSTSHFYIPSRNSRRNRLPICFPPPQLLWPTYRSFIQ